MNLSTLFSLLNTNNNSATGLLLPRQVGVQQGVVVNGATPILAGAAGSPVKLSDYGRLQSGLSDLRSATSKIDSPDKVAKAVAKSNNAKITASVASDGAQPLAAAVAVSQLAQSQVVQSASFGADDSELVGTGSLAIQFGNFNASTNTFTAGQQPVATVTIGVLDSTLGGVANAINRADIGVSASIVTDSGGARLQLSGNQTGANQAFTVSVSNSGGIGADSTQGLSQLAYNPSAVPGAGRNLVQTQAAQDALLTVNGRPYASASNTVTGAVTGITLSASEAGAAQVSISRDADSALKSAQAFTSAYNQLRDQISLVQSDSVSRQIAGNIGAAAGNATVNTAQGNLSLPQLGISQASDGKLTLDAGKFRAAFSANPEGAANLLATAAKRVESAADSAINGPLRSATQAIQTATGNGDNPYVVPAAAQTPQQLILGSLPTLLPYSPTTRNLYGLSQYLSISGL